MKREWLILALWVLIFILVRSLHFTAGLNFSVDQASDSLKGLELLRDHKITLIGTHTGFSYQGRLLFQGPLFIYTYMAYNLLGRFDPILSSYIFMLTGSLAIIPLYFGMKRLANRYAAIVAVIAYSLTPYFINYTKFMWNPNFQLIFTPLLIYCFSRFNEKKSFRWLLATSTVAGALLQYHYQFVIIISALGLYLLYQENKFKNVLTLFLGIMIGFSPVILFEIRHDFYNLRTVILFIQHFNEVFLSSGGKPISPHFFLSVSLVALSIILVLLKKFVNKYIVVGAVILLLPFSVQYLKQPNRMYNSDIPWRFEDELKVYGIIKKFDLKETNVSHLDYNNTAEVQKYLLARDGKPHSSDYYTNRYLFAVSKTNMLDSYKAYEISTFSPRTVVQSWPISTTYTLYLLERTAKPL